MKRRFRHILIAVLATAALFSLSACGGDQDGGTASTGEVSITRKPGIPKSDEQQSGETAEAVEAADTANIYIVQLLNTKKEKIFLKNLATGREYVYKYSLMTDFYDKYGGDTNITEFGPGRAVNIEENGSDRILDVIRASKEVWTYDDITNYELDEDRGVLKIGSANYRLSDATMVFSDDVEAAYSDIGDDDTLAVVGLDKDILTITITTGHGYLTVINTDNFEGSLLCVGTKIFAKVTNDMTLTVPEGKYTVTAANNGYGGSKKVKIKRNVTTVLDLKELEGEGPKYCKLVVKSSVEGSNIYLDGEKIKEGKKTKVPYGRHTLTIDVEGYDTWTRTLFVNSETAEITVDPTKSSGSQEDDEPSSEATTESQSASSENSSDVGKDKDGDGDYDEDDAEVDYLSTINDMLKNISGLSD